jgi:hypothetical protein
MKSSSPDVFAYAVHHLKPDSWDIFASDSFKRDYLPMAGITEHSNTAEYISINSLTDLTPSLRRAEAMVLRLGASRNHPSTTKFAVVGTPGRLKDFFLMDHEIFDDASVEGNPPIRLNKSLFGYSLLPKITEKSVVNLAFAAGIVGDALNLDQPYPTAAPAAGNGTYSFTFQPHSEMRVELSHDRGQVDVDAAFVGRRNGRDCLFVLEAKTEKQATRQTSLAVHKLVYPVLALCSQTSLIGDMPIIPVYMRATLMDSKVRYKIVECALPDPRTGLVGLDQLRPLTGTARIIDISIN